MRLDHRSQHIAHRQLAAVSRKPVCYGENAAKIVARMPPFSREPGVIEIQPSNNGPDVEGRRYRVEFKAGSGHARPAPHRKARHNRPEQLRAGREFQSQQAAAQRVEQAIPCGLIGQVAVDGVVQHIVGDVGNDLIETGADIGNMAGHSAYTIFLVGTRVAMTSCSV